MKDKSEYWLNNLKRIKTVEQSLLFDILWTLEKINKKLKARNQK